MATKLEEVAIGAVIKMLEGLEIEPGGDLEATILEGIDFKTIAASLAGDPEGAKTLKDAVKNAIENTDADALGETVDEAFGLNDAGKLSQLLGKEGQDELTKIVLTKVREHLEDLDVSNMDQNALYSLVTESEVFKRAIDASVETLVRTGKIDRLVEEAVNSMLSGEHSLLQEQIRVAVTGKIANRVADSTISRLFEGCR